MELNCEICGNSGYILKMVDDPEYGQFMTTTPCECMNKRRYLQMINKYGYGEEIFNKLFSNFETNDDWQKVIKEKATSFVKKKDARLFFTGGQVGAGKTHISTAIINTYLKCGSNCQYVIWNDIVTKLKQNIFDNKDKYYEDLNDLKFAQVLYIDDFFKNEFISKDDIDKAFQIINSRYLNPKLITIISSEKTIQELLLIDEAVASRIYEMAGCGNYAISITKDITKNYRLRKNKEIANEGIN